MDEFTHTNPEEKTTKPSIMKRIRENPKTRNFVIGLFTTLAIYWLSRSCNTSNEEEQIERTSQIKSRNNCNKEIESSKPITVKRLQNSLYINNEYINLGTNIKLDETQIFIYSDTTNNFNIENINIEDINGIPDGSKITYANEWSSIQIIKTENWKEKTIRTLNAKWQQYLWVLIIDKDEKNHMIIIWKLINKINKRKTDIENKLKNLKNSSNKIIDLSLWNKVDIVSAKLEINWNNVRINYPYLLTPTSIPYSWKWILRIGINNNQDIKRYSFYIDIPESREENLDDSFDFESEFWSNNSKEYNNQDWLQWIIENITRINKLWIHHQTVNEYNQLISDIKIMSTANNNDEYNKTEWQLITTAYLSTGNIYSQLEKRHKNNPNNIYLITNSTWENLNTQTLNDLIKCSTLNNVILFLNFANIEQISKLSEIQASSINKSHIFITIPDNLIKNWNWENNELKIPEWFFDWNFWWPIFWWNSFSDTHTWYTVIEINPYKYHDKLWENDTIDPQ